MSAARWGAACACAAPVWRVLRRRAVLRLPPRPLSASLPVAVRTASLQALPPILYQQLLFASTAPGLRTYMLRLLLEVFCKLEKRHAAAAGAGSSAGAAAAAAAAGAGLAPAAAQQPEQLPNATLLQVQATFLMHVSTVLKYDAALGSEWLKWASKEGAVPRRSIPAFVLLQLLLTMSRQPKLEAPVLQLLRRRVAEACEEDAAAASGAGAGSGAAWMADLRPVAATATLAALEADLLKAVRCSTYASELVVPGLLQLAGQLIGTHCAAPLHVVLAVKQGAGCSGLPPQAPASARAVVLGLQLLLEVFERHAEARAEVLKLTQARLCGSLDGALPVVLLLARVSQEQPALLTAHLPQLKACLGSFAGLCVGAQGGGGRRARAQAPSAHSLLARRRCRPAQDWTATPQSRCCSPSGRCAAAAPTCPTRS